LGVGQSIISRLGDKTKARVYRLMAYSTVDKKDTANAKQYIDTYFQKAKPEEITALDYSLKANIYSAIPGQEDVVFTSYLDGLKADTVLDNKIDLLKQGSKFFADRKQYEKEGQLELRLLALKPTPTINDYFAPGLAFYRTKTDSGYARSYNLFKTVSEKFPDQSFGWEWMYNNAIVIDTVKRDSIAVPAALALLKFAQTDTVKYAKQISNASYYLATYYLEVKKDKDKAIGYLRMMQAASKDEATKQSIEKNIQLLLNPPRPQQQPARTGTPRGNTQGSPKPR